MSDATPRPIVPKTFYALQEGWLDGHGLAPSREGLDWFATRFDQAYPEDLPLPYVYPTEAGGVRAEWDLNGWDISLDVNLIEHTADWHALHGPSDQEVEQRLMLDDDDAWTWIAEQIRSHGEAS